MSIEWEAGPQTDSLYWGIDDFYRRLGEVLAGNIEIVTARFSFHREWKKTGIRLRLILTKGFCRRGRAERDDGPATGPPDLEIWVSFEEVSRERVTQLLLRGLRDLLEKRLAEAQTVLGEWQVVNRAVREIVAPEIVRETAPADTVV